MSLILRLVPDAVRGFPIWAWLATLLVLVGAHLALRAWHRAKTLPPGPWGLPLLGYLPWLNPVAPQLTFGALAKRYGRIYSLQMGGVTCVVMTDTHLIKDVFNRSEANGRAPLYLTHGIMKGYGKYRIVFHYHPNNHTHDFYYYHDYNSYHHIHNHNHKI
ncbi:unnamed protein product [Meganyctiphanes norvegica]|uniref:Cytochrome P450 n=1 Tax=Meganyctiphanes norvegica TaxID=48144 RepID=A0AAV2R9H5_MEGNR